MSWFKRLFDTIRSWFRKSVPVLPPAPQTIEFEEDPADISNPCRGWYGDGERLEGYMPLLPIQGAISANQLAEISKRLELIELRGSKAILRFRYDKDGVGTDATLPTMLMHIDQLKPVLRTWKKAIFVLQAGLIGKWGEWHGSSHGHHESPETRKQVTMALLDAFPGKVAVRRPTWHKQLVYLGADPERLAVHDDCILCSASDGGSWPDGEDTWREYIGENCGPFGGEVSRMSITPVDFYGGENAIKLFEEMGLVYAARHWNPAVFESWKQSGHYDEIVRRMGYRIVLEELEVNGRTLSLHLRNDGFAAPHSATAWLRVGEETIISLGDIKRWIPGAGRVTRTISSDMLPAGTWEVSLEIEGDVRCANVEGPVLGKVKIG